MCLINVSTNLLRRKEDEGGRLFSRACAERTRGNGHRLKDTISQLHMRNQYSPVGVIYFTGSR